jgi:tripartite-type tricarboxylate transporter receptor subunit TctC
MKVRTIAILLLAAFAPAAWAQQPYPSKPIRLLVPFAPGGGVDLISRVIGPQITKSFGQQVVVDNRPGGGGTIAAETVVRADPDGYTLLMASGAYSANAALYNLPYDPLADIQPIVRIGETGFIIVVRPALPVKTVKELIAHAKANPGKLNYGSSGTGGIQHLATELFKLETKTQMTHVPYKGMGPALTANIGGEIDLTFGSIPSTQPHVRSGRLRAIAVTSAKRSSALPDVPTASETVPGFEVVNWFGIVGPKGMHKSTVTRLNTEVGKALRSDEMKAQMATEGVEPDGGPPEQFLHAIRREIQDWKRVVKEAKITAAG